MRIAISAVSITSFGLLALSGCGKTRDDVAVAPTPTLGSSAASVPPVPTTPPSSFTPPASASAAVAQAEPKLGTQQSLTDWNGDLKVTVLSYRQPVAKSAPQPDQNGHEYGSLVVKVCNADDHTQTVNTSPFRLVYADDTEIDSTNTGYNQFPEPEFPWGDHQLASGRCVQGSIVFEVPKKSRPREVSYVADAEIAGELLADTKGSVTYWSLR